MRAAAEEHTRQVVGKKVDHRAILRLHRLWPQAHVEVQHNRPLAGGPVDELYTGKQIINAKVKAKREGRKVHPGTHGGKTIVWIFETRPGKGAMRFDISRVEGTSLCVGSDPFDPQRGIELAFRRAMKELAACLNQDAEEVRPGVEDGADAEVEDLPAEAPQ